MFIRYVDLKYILKLINETLAKFEQNSPVTHQYSCDNVTGGNAGLAAAYSARKLKVPCTIVVPGTTPMFIVDRLREEGATVEICGKVSCMVFLLLDCII